MTATRTRIAAAATLPAGGRRVQRAGACAAAVFLLYGAAHAPAHGAPEAITGGILAAAPAGLKLTPTMTCGYCDRLAMLSERQLSRPVEIRSGFDLDQLVELAILNHPTVASRRAELNAARAEVDVARQAFYPSPAAQVQQGAGNQGALLSLQQPLWTSGRLTAGLNAADTRARATDLSITEAQLALALRASAAYESWLQAQARQAVLKRSMRQLETYVERIERRIQGGASALVDRELVQARLAQSQSDFSTAESAGRNALVQLSQLCGRSLEPGQLAVAVNPGPAVDSLARLDAEAVASNPALRRIALDIEAAEYDTEQRRAALWPTLSLRAEHQRNSATAGLPGVHDNRIFVMLEYTPGAGFSAGAQIDAGSARIQGLRENREAARRDLRERIAIEYENHRAALARQRDFERTVASSGEVLASYDRQFVAGKRGWLDVLNAARELTQAELAAADIGPQRSGSRYRLRLLAGEQPWLQRRPDPTPVPPGLGSRIQNAFIHRSEP